MAIVKVPKESSIRIKFSAGQDGKGNEIIKNKTLPHVKSDAVDDNVHAVAKEIAALSQHTLMEIVRVDNSALNE